MRTLSPVGFLRVIPCRTQAPRAGTCQDIRHHPTSTRPWTPAGAGVAEALALVPHASGRADRGGAVLGPGPDLLPAHDGAPLGLERWDPHRGVDARPRRARPREHG